MKIGFISQYFLPEPGAAAHPGVVARALSHRGHEVRVLTGFPSYPHGDIYPGYRQSLRFTERIDGMRVRRVPYFLSHDESGARRAASMITFGLSATAQSGEIAGSDVQLVYASPATTAMAAMTVRRLRGTPYVLYIQDLWPDTVLASGMLGNHPHLERQVTRVLHRACAAMYAGAERIAVIADGMKDVLVARGVPADKVEVVYNWVDEHVFREAPADPELASALHEQASFALMYAGGMGELQALETAVDAMRIVGNDADVHLALVGEGVSKARLRARVADLGLTNISFWDARPLARMPATMAAADAQLVSLRDLPLFRATIPSKVQAAMACGQPVVSCAPGDATRVVEAAGAGVAAAPDSPDDLARAILRMRDMGADQRRAMGERARQYYEAELAERIGASRLERLLTQAADA